MIIQYKTEIWNRMIVDDQNISDIIERLKNGDTIWDFYNDEISTELEPILDTEVLLTPDENDGQSTIEVYDCENCAPIWTNEIKKI